MNDYQITGPIGDLFVPAFHCSFGYGRLSLLLVLGALTVSYVHKCSGFALPLSMRRFTLEEGAFYTVGFGLET
jgi:hypothetical protein